LELVANPADSTGKTKKLADDLYFVDTDKFVWKAGKNDITDGASIPGLFKAIIGESFEADFLPAAVIHDHYTDRSHRVRTWRATAHVFYQAMLVNGVNVVKAKTMYFAVYTFGPHWATLAKGVPCGQRCVFDVRPSVTTNNQGDIILSDTPVPLGDDKVYAEESSDYDEAHLAEIEELQKKIEGNELRGTPMSLKDLDALATLDHGDNIFLTADE
jgi:hypothetical protein